MSPRRLLTLLCLFIFSVSALLGACCADQRRPVVWHAHPYKKILLSIDVRFTPLERGLIDRAIADINYQTAGWVVVNHEYDFDGAGTEAEFSTPNTLVREESYDFVVMMVEAHRGGTVAGFTVEENRSFIVSDRLITPSQWRSVVAHELLHQAGLDDLRDMSARRAVMFWYKDGVELPTCLTWHDVVEMCRRYGCSPEKTNFCGPKGT